MDTVDDALEALKSILGLPRLSLDDNGQASILVENLIHIDLSKQSETELELSTAITELQGKLTPARLFALMKANYLGHHTGAARFALDPRDNEPVFCQRVDVGALDAGRLEAELAAFVAYVSYWLADGVDTILAIEDDTASAPAQGLSAPADTMFMRI